MAYVIYLCYTYAIYICNIRMLYNYIILVCCIGMLDTYVIMYRYVRICEKYFHSFSLQITGRYHSNELGLAWSRDDARLCQPLYIYR